MDNPKEIEKYPIRGFMNPPPPDRPWWEEDEDALRRSGARILLFRSMMLRNLIYELMAKIHRKHC